MNTRTFPSSGYNPQSVVTATFDKRATKAKKAFVQWLNRKHPDLLRKAIREAKVSRSQLGLDGFGQEDDTPWYDKILDTVETALPTWAAIEQQKELIKINERRARQGLDPINSANISVEAGAETRQALQTGIKDATAQYIPYLVGGGLLLLLLRKK